MNNYTNHLSGALAREAARGDPGLRMIDRVRNTAAFCSRRFVTLGRPRVRYPSRRPLRVRVKTDIREFREVVFEDVGF